MSTPQPSPTPARPQQVTLAGWVIVAGSVLVVLSGFEIVSGIGSLDTRERVQERLASPSGSGLGLGVEGALRLLRVAATVGAASAAAAAILGWQVLQRSRSARVVLSVLAGPLLVTGLVTDQVLPFVVCAAVGTLWAGPARDWFAGRAPREPAAAPPPVQWPARPARGAVPTPGAEPVGRPPRRPEALLWACVVTWTAASLCAVFAVVGAVLLVATPDVVRVAMEQQGQTFAEDDVGRFLLVTALVVVWCALASGLAVAAFRGWAWGRSALHVSAVTAAVVSLLAMLGTLTAVVPMVAAMAAARLLRRPEVRAWASRRRGRVVE